MIIRYECHWRVCGSSGSCVGNGREASCWADNGRRARRPLLNAIVVGIILVFWGVQEIGTVRVSCVATFGLFPNSKRLRSCRSVVLLAGNRNGLDSAPL